ncbi:MAG: VOC family protein [Lachnospiraceae bacterium]|nr:VOC family protein [Lachnospiraceae bacterium]
MRYGSIYLVVRDFDKSVSFYEKVFDMKVRATNGKRFAMFDNQGLNLCLMNGYYDIQNKEQVKTEGEYWPIYDDIDKIAESESPQSIH